MMQNGIGQIAVGVALMVSCFPLAARATTNITGTVPGHPRARVSKHATGDRLLVSTGMVIYIR